MTGRPPAIALRLDQPFADLLQETFLRLVGRPLIDGRPKDAAFLYDEMAAPLLAHDTSDDPRIVYANKTAQACFGYDAAEIAGLPSRLSAEPSSREARQALLDEVARAGFVRDYSGVRIAKSGRKFRIENAIVWDLVDGAGTRHGQAATFEIGADLPG